MLENFIFSHQKTAFEEALSNNEVPDGAIVFIGDTKEIWARGNYFDGNTFNPTNLNDQINDVKTLIDQLKKVKTFDLSTSLNNAQIEELHTYLILFKEYNEASLHWTNGSILPITRFKLNYNDCVFNSGILLSCRTLNRHNGAIVSGTDHLYYNLTIAYSTEDNYFKDDTSSSTGGEVVNPGIGGGTLTPGGVGGTVSPGTSVSLDNYKNYMMIAEVYITITINSSMTPQGIIKSYSYSGVEGIHTYPMYIITSGSGNKFLSDNGLYKEIPTNTTYLLDLTSFNSVKFSELKTAVENNRSIKLVTGPLSSVIPDNVGRAVGVSSLNVTLRFDFYAENAVNTTIKDYSEGYIEVTCKSNGTYTYSSNTLYIEKTGDGTKFLSDDGEYKEINIEQIKKEVINNGVIEFPSKYEFVDLGLPSGTMWATCNIGANSPEGSGLYFAWGETEGYTADDVAAGKKAFTWNDYKFGNSDALTKYNSTDGLIQLELIDDAAYQRDSTFRIPSYNEVAELNNLTTSTWETLNGVNGRRFTSKINSNSIFIPAAGYYNSGSLEYGNSQGYYWGNGIVSYSTDYGDYFGFNEEYAYPYSTSRNYGFPIRPVKSSKFAPVDLKNLPKTPYVWDGTTISETIFMELLTAIRSNREIILSNLSGLLNYRLISSAYMQDILSLTFCEIVDAPNFLFTIYNITPNSVEFITTSFYNKRDSDSTRLKTAYYNNLGLLTQDTKFTNKGTLSDLEYEGQFHFGDTIYNITFPSGVKWSTDSVLDYKPNHTYQFRIVKGFGVMKEFANS